jgi:hypothetical protein
MQDYETQYEKATVNFEAVKIAMRQDKNGYVLTLSVHPDDVPESLLRNWVGSRYQVAMVQLSDDEQPIIPKHKSEGAKYVAKAGLICKEREFQLFMFDRSTYGSEELKEHIQVNYTLEDCVEDLRKELNVSSRKELMEDKKARYKLDELIKEFRKSKYYYGRR